jgi:putative ABC transport system permease protein
MIVFHGRTSLQAGGTRAGRVVHWVDDDLPAIHEQATDCEYAIPELEQNDVAIHSNFNNAAFTVTGSYPPFGYIRSLDVGDGRFYNWEDQQEGRYE